MPVLQIHLIEGYDAKTKARLASAVTDAVRLVVPATPEAVTVMLHDLPACDYFRGGTPRTPAPARPDPVATARGFLAAMEARDLDAARGFLAPGFTMTFPGTGPMTDLEDFIAWARPRYQNVRKTFEGADTLQQGEATVVYLRGTLSGNWPDGGSFTGIRFIDRFEIKNGQITRQDVWNDVAETRHGRAKQSRTVTEAPA